MFRSHDGLIWVVMFNSRPEDYSEFRDERSQLISEAINSIQRWPTHDLFSLFGYE